MPKIVEYTAPLDRLTESTRGTAAWEQAGRRLGPLYNEAAQFQKQQGADVAQEIKDQEWPFDIARLLAEQNKFGYHIGGRGIGEDASAVGGKTRIELPDNSMYAVSQITAGMGALGRSLNDGGYAMASSTPIMTEEGGNLVTAAQDTKLTTQYNNFNPTDATVSQWTNDAITAQANPPGSPTMAQAGMDFEGGGNPTPDNSNAFSGLGDLISTAFTGITSNSSGASPPPPTDAGAAAMTAAEGSQ